MGRCPEDSRLKEVAELLRLRPAAKKESTMECVSYEFYNHLLQQRDDLYTAVISATRALVAFDEQLIGCFCTKPPVREKLQGLEAAIRAAAPKVQYGGDWAALLLLLRERGTEMTETELSRMVARTVPDAVQCTRQMIISALWVPGCRFPDWKPNGCRQDKFERHWAVACAAALHL